MTESSTHDQWWVASVGNMLVWSRLRLRPSGTAEVFDSSGTTLNYDSEDSARSALLDAEFRSLDGLDEDDALAMGVTLDGLQPPQADEDEYLVAQMVQMLPSSH